MHMAEITRRAVVAAAVLAAVPGAQAADPLFTADEVLTMRAETIIRQYLAHGIELVPQPDGQIFKFIYVDDGMTNYERAAEEKLDQRLRDDPELGRRVKETLRRYHSM